MSDASYAGEGVQSRWTEAYLRAAEVRRLDARWNERWERSKGTAEEDPQPEPARSSTERVRAFREANIAAGLCAECGRTPPEEGKRVCSACKERQAKRRHCRCGCGLPIPSYSKSGIAGACPSRRKVTP